MAIGALNFDTWADIDHGMEKHQREFAYNEYNMVIARLMKPAKESGASIGTRLLTCLLFACFETYHSNNELAIAQTSIGIDMIAEYESTLRSEQSLAQPEPPLEKGILETFAILEVQSVMYDNSKSNEYHLQLCKLLSDLKQWNAAFQPLLKKARRPEGKDIFGVVSLLRLNYLASYVWFAASTSDTQLLSQIHTRASENCRNCLGFNFDR